MSVSFTVRRPTPDSSDVDASTPGFKIPAVPQRLRGAQNSRTSSPLNPNGKRKLAFDDSDEEQDEVTEELVVGFDKLGAQRATEKPKNELAIIPALPNKDWRALAKAASARRKGYLPGYDEGKAAVGADGSQGGLGTKEIINSGPQQSGLIVYKKRKIEEEEMSANGETHVKMEIEQDEVTKSEPEAPISDEQKAINALIAAAKRANGEEVDDVPFEAIPMPIPLNSNFVQQQSETDAYREDVASRPDSASLEDYKRMPVEQFGTALLMGMGWKPGQGASKSGKGPSEASVPKARPALLGLGAKPQDAELGSSSKGKGKPSKRYVPVVAVEREGSSRGDSRRGSERPDRDGDRERDRDRDRRERSERDRSRDRSERRDRDGKGRRDYDRDRDYDRKDRRRDDDGDDRRRDDRRRDDDRKKDRYREERSEDRRDGRGERDDSRKRK